MGTTNSPVFFGDWVKRRRKALDLTQEELAQRAGCSIFALRKIESGERRPSKQLADLLAESLEISTEEKPTFIRVARGETNLERLRAPSKDSSYATIADMQPASVLNRLPIQPTELVGRDAEFTALAKIFNDPQCRLLTLIGMGGIGKTRLAIEFVARQQSCFPAGVFYTPLAPINSPEAIVPTIADVVGFVFSGPNDPKEQLIAYIAAQCKQPVLLVLDNFEHLLVHPLTGEKSDAVELVSEFLQRIPNIKILATSRERLNLRGEWTYELHGLAVPPPIFASKLEDYSAAELFIQCALRIKADFELTASERKAIVQICQSLDGTPLAIELAAAWVDVLSCQEIFQEINANIDFLTTSMRDIPERHRSLRATFDHSWKLLTVEEQNVLCRLSVFQGEFDRVAAQKIAGATLPLLASLVSKSLVRRTDNHCYDLHEVIRQFARSHLDVNPTQRMEIEELHGDHYLNLVSGYEKKLKSAAQQDAIREIVDSFDNIMAAWDWAVNQRKYALLDRAARCIGWVFEITGLLGEGIDRLQPLEQILKNEPHGGRWDRLLGLSLLQQGLLFFRRGQFSRAQELYRESVAVLRPVGDNHLLADALIFLGTITHLNGDYSQSRTLIQEGLAFARACKDQFFEAYGIYNLGYVDSLEGSYQKGYEQLKIGIDQWRVLGDPLYIALGLNFMAPTLCKLERFDEAKASMVESIKICEQSKNRWGKGTAYRYLGLANLAEGDYLAAQANFYKSLEVFGESVVGWDIALSFTYLGEAILMTGDLSQARQVLLKALHIAVEANSIPIAIDALLGLAKTNAQMGNDASALELIHFILGHPSSTQESKDRASQLKIEIEKQMPNDQVEAVEKRFENHSLESIIEKLTAA